MEVVEFFQDKVQFPYPPLFLGLNLKSDATFRKQACIQLMKTANFRLLILKAAFQGESDWPIYAIRQRLKQNSQTKRPFLKSGSIRHFHNSACMLTIGCGHQSGPLLCYTARERHETVSGFRCVANVPPLVNQRQTRLAGVAEPTETASRLIAVVQLDNGFPLMLCLAWVVP